MSDTAAIRGALNQVIARGEPVVTMVTDVAATGAHAYVGIDNFKAGRTVGLLLRRLPWVGHEASAEHRQLLAAGQMDLVMDQDAPA